MSTPRGILAVGIVLVAAIVVFLPRLVQPGVHIAPPLTPEFLPTAIVFSPLMYVVSFLDKLNRAITPPNLYLFKELMSYVHTVELYTAAELKVADLIADAPGGRISISALAVQATGCTDLPCDSFDCSSEQHCLNAAKRLQRVLRATAAFGIFAECDDGMWSNTAASEFLREGHENSLRATALNFGDIQFKMMSFLPDTVRTGYASFRKEFNDEFWAYYATHPAAHEVFDKTMLQLGRLGGADTAIANDFDFGARVDVLVDIGGGYGDMLANVLLSNPNLRGILFDQLPVIQRAEKVWEARDEKLRTRVQLVPGDMFAASTIPSAINTLTKAARRLIVNGQSPQGQCTDAIKESYGYTLRDIVHDWPDSDVIRILKALRSVMRANESVCLDANGILQPGSVLSRPFPDKIFLVTRLIRPGVAFIDSMGSNDADIVMLGAFGTTAGERTEDHFKQLLSAADLTLVSVTPTRSHYFILEARAT